MKIKFVSTYPPANCGIAAYSMHYVEALKRLCDVDVVPIQPQRTDPLYFMRMGGESRKNADVIHVQYELSFFGNKGMYTPIFYLFARLFGGPPIVTTIHEFLDSRKTYRGKLRYYPMFAYYWTIYRFIALCSDAILVHTEGMKERLSQYGNTDKMSVLPHACFVRPAFLPQDECKAKLGLSGKKLITIFGYINTLKGHDMAIEAMKSLPEDVVLYIAGDGRLPEDKAYVDSLKEKVKASGLEKRVLFHGYLEDRDVPAVMCASDVVLMPYRHVTQSGAVNYPLSYRKPTLASDIGGFSEIAKAYGCIDTFNAGDIEDMRSELMRLLHDPSFADKLKTNSAAYVSSVGLDTISKRIFNIYSSLIGHKDRP